MGDNNQNTTAFFRVSDLGKSYESATGVVTALDGVNFELERGASLAICGPSGAGKSTLLNLLGGLDRPTSGGIFYDGREISGLSEDAAATFRRVSLGFVFQFHHLLQDFDVIENVMMPLLLQGKGRAAASEDAASWLARVGLSGKERRRPRELSGGEQQRVAIARALISRPGLVLADEPTGNLDHAAGERVFDLLCTLNRDLNATLIVVTHNDDFARKLKHRLMLTSGRVTSFS